MRKNSILFLFWLCTGMLGSSCKSVSVFKVQDLDGRWTIVSVQNEPVTLENMPWLEFNIEAKRVHGYTGCNTLSAGFEPDSKDVSAFQMITPITTMMACIHFESESTILQAINNVTNAKKGETPGQVKLVDKDGNTLLVMEKAA